MKKLLFLILIITLTIEYQGQDIDYARKVMRKLTSKHFRGRGYVKNGDAKAAAYIAGQFEKNEVNTIDSVYYQSYQIPINTFPGKLVVEVDKNRLTPGREYVISCSSASVEGTFPLALLPDTITTDSGFIQSINKFTGSGLYLVSSYFPRKLYGKTIDGIRGVVIRDNKTPVWHVSNGYSVQQTTWLKIKESALPADAKQIYISAASFFFENYKTQNVSGYIKGKKDPYRFIVFTAHYDHLGMMGNKTYFPGANDNASGTAMVLDLARHYALPENRPDYSIAFMLFSGEEAGLHGSRYYVNNPLFPMEQIRMLINLDMVGTGSEGITVVNGKAYKDVMNEFERINGNYNYLTEIKARGEACNSDHCPFYQTGVKSVFIYTRGKEHLKYHTITDTDDEFPFTAYDGLFRLLTKYVESVQL